MKYLFFLSTFLLCSLSSCSAQSLVNIPPGESVVLDYPNYENADVQLKNKSMKDISVSVLNKETDARLRSFGLRKWARETVKVESTSKLVLQNNNDTAVDIKVSLSKSARPIAVASTKKVNFSLRNSSNASIPLIIPKVMNPNLSPNSMSSVTLRMGQEILFRARGKKYVLLTVDESIEKGDILDVAKLLLERKKELGISK